MGIAFKQFKLYFKLIIIGLVVLVLVLTLFMNRSNVASVWFFKEYTGVNVLKLMLLTAVGAIICFWFLTMTLKIWKEWRSVSQEAAEQERLIQLEQRTKELEQKEPQVEENNQ